MLIASVHCFIKYVLKINKYFYYLQCKKTKFFQRNEGLKWLRDHSNELQRGVNYFMDDDRYDIRLFDKVSYNEENKDFDHLSFKSSEV